VGAVPLTCLPAHPTWQIEYLAKFTEAAARLIPSEFRKFNYIAMAEELRGQLPSLREIFVGGEHAGSGMTLISDRLSDSIAALKALSGREANR
jgi:non-ribosomal peptide synthetase component E (peptide arylation enzyme)